MKTLTNFFFILGLLLAALLTSAQNNADKIYNYFDGKDGVSSFTFSKNMTDAFNIDLGDDGEEQKVTGDLQKIRLMSYNPRNGDMSGESFVRKAVSMLPSQYKKYEGEDNDDDNAEIWLLGKGKKYTECHVFIRNENEDSNVFVVSFYGDFTVNDLEGLKKTGKGFSN
jgi:hypothetical protein